MKRSRIILILAASLLLVGAGAGLALQEGAESIYDPTRPPALPPSPPPECAPPGAGPSAQEDGASTAVQYDLPAGWSVVSFPFARVTAVEGLTRMLLHYAGGNYHQVDPRADIGTLDTNHAYLAYCDRPSTVTAWGTENTERTCMLDLENGWNLVGCPFGREIPWSAVLVARQSSRRSIEAAASPSIDPGDFWISSFAFRFNGSASVFDIEAPGQALAPREGQWVFAWQQVLLLINQSAQPSAAPRIESATPEPLSPGAVVTVTGSSFGSTPEEVIVAGVQIPPEAIVSWADDRVEFRLPPDIPSGPLSLSCDHAVSPPVQVTVLEPPPSDACGTIRGKVQSSSGRPLPGAQILLDDAVSATAGTDGAFTLSDVPSGSHSIHAFASGFRDAKGVIEVAEGATRSVCIELSPISGVAPFLPAAGERPAGNAPPSSPRKAEKVKARGNLHIVADTYDSGSTRLWVHRIEVNQVGGECLRWSNSWDTDVGDTYKELNCDGAIAGETYRIKITWKGKDGVGGTTNTWDRKLYSSDQTETFDSPW